MPDAFLLQVLKDLRVAPTQSAHEKAVADELQFVDSLPTCIWKFLASAADMWTGELRNMVLEDYDRIARKDLNPKPNP